jgi:hypothetical protein
MSLTNDYDWMPTICGTEKNLNTVISRNFLESKKLLKFLSTGKHYVVYTGMSLR